MIRCMYCFQATLFLLCGLASGWAFETVWERQQATAQAAILLSMPIQVLTEYPI